MNLHPKGEPTNWLACGICIGCMESKQQELTIRMKHEARNYVNKYFLTLTYDDEHLPHGLQKNDPRKFLKKVRIAQQRTGNQTLIKYMLCGEYGDRTKREHYHAAVLGLAISDSKKWDTDNDRSPTIEKQWGNGIVTISELTDVRIQYVAGYVLKKAGYKKQLYCDEDGEELQKPYRDFSKGLGAEWIDRYATDVQHGYLQDGKNKFTIPRYYRDRIKKQTPELDQFIQQQQSQNWKELTRRDRELLHNGEKIRLKQIRENKPRGRV